MNASTVYDFSNLCLSPLHSWSTSTFIDPQPSPMLLLKDPVVDRELRWIARKLIRRQRFAHETAAAEDTVALPGLYVILPRNSTAIKKNRSRSGSHGGSVCAIDPAEQDFCVHFLCDYGAPQDQTIRLHVCKDFSCTDDADTEGEGQDGLRLYDFDNFLLHHTITMLSLLRVLQENDDPNVSGTSLASPAMAGRIKTAIRFLATRAYETLLNFRDHPSAHEDDLNEFEALIPSLKQSDFMDPAEAVAYVSGNVHGTLGDVESTQENSWVLFRMSAYTGVEDDEATSMLWVCQAHQEMFRDAPRTERLARFVEEHHGTWIPVKKQLRIQMESRSDARLLYEILDEYRGVLAMEIGLLWQKNEGDNKVTDEDLWELCITVHKLDLRELTVDCGAGGDGRGGESGLDADDEAKPSFRPLLGMICRQGLETLTVQKFNGDIFPGGRTIKAEGDLAAFSLQQFRESSDNASTLVVPENISLRKLYFFRWERYPDIPGFTSMVLCLPNLTHLETLTSCLKDFFLSIQNATTTLGSITYVGISESALESAEITVWRVAGGGPALRKVQRRTNKGPNIYQQSLLGLENYTITECARLWDHPEALHNVIHNNIGALTSLDLACETEGLGLLWPLVVKELMEAEVIAEAAALARGGDERGHDYNDDSDGDEAEAVYRKYAVPLRLDDLKGHALESLCPQQPDQTRLALKTYDDGFRPYMEPLSYTATILSIDWEFKNAEELELLVKHTSVDGLWFYELLWFQTEQTRHPRFMSVLRELVQRPEVQTFTIQVDGEGLEQIQILLQSWNELTGMSLGWNEYGRWMQELVEQLEHPFEETLRLPTGAGELTFSSVDYVAIGAAVPEGFSAKWTSPSGVVNCRGPVVYALSCRVA
ncbi:hypothetical protein BGZ54_003194 [Gamsiella multidivaricata]|nr:hypothetical protein BGZ54_003194 [Gamsiella multidivaricata]